MRQTHTHLTSRDIAKGTDNKEGSKKDMSDLTISLVRYMQQEFEKIKTKLTKAEEKQYAEIREIYIELESAHNKLQ